jgi:CRISPR-associated protein Cas2
MRLMVVAYDIPDDRRRTRVHKALLRLGTPIQDSVFLVHHEQAHEVKAREVADLLRPLLRLKEDNVRLHPLCESCAERSVLLGLASTPTQPTSYRIV